MLGSLDCIFPKLSSERVETLKSELREELVQEIQKLKENTDYSD